MSDYYKKLQEKEMMLSDLKDEQEILETELKLKELKGESSEEEETALKKVKEDIKNLKDEIKIIKQEEETQNSIIKLTKEVEILKKKRDEKLAERAKINQIITCEHNYVFDKTENFSHEDFGDIFTEEYTYTADVYKCTKCGYSIEKNERNKRDYNKKPTNWD